jgi:hypothetical protein
VCPELKPLEFVEPSAKPVDKINATFTVTSAEDDVYKPSPAFVALTMQVPVVDEAVSVEPETVQGPLDT